MICETDLRVPLSNVSLKNEKYRLTVKWPVMELRWLGQFQRTGRHLGIPDLEVIKKSTISPGRGFLF